ncbi:MAG: C4-dicarboxylate ABC transporter substrate-binding protein, partial [Synergistaceae bacterium]|nr:C4-dicarboxylate ABC transporter substrate-binding protein [Synergistaceae bacterium]
MKKLAAALLLVFCFTLAACAELTEPVKLIFAAQEVGTGAYSVSAAIQGAMLKGLPAGSTIDLTTNSPGGVGAPVLIQR